MTHKLKDSLCEIGAGVSLTGEQKRSWVDNAVRVRPILQRRRRLMVAAVAAAATFALVGFGYAMSVYFDKIFMVEEESFEEPETAIAYQHIDEDAVKELMGGKGAGEILNATVDTAEGAVEFRGIRGDTLDVAYLRKPGDEGWEKMWAEHGTPDEPVQAAKANNLDTFISRGSFVPALEGEGYSLLNVRESGSGGLWLSYQNASGSQIRVRAMSGQPVITPEENAGLQVKDITIGDRTFVYVEGRGAPGEVELYLYMGDDADVISVMLGGSPETPAEEILEAAKHLVLHNEESIKRAALDTVFFQAFRDPVIRESAADIAAAFAAAEPGESDEDVTLWSQDGRTIKAYPYAMQGEFTSAFSIEYEGMPYETIKELAQAVDEIPYERYDWFPGEQLTAATFVFNDNKLTSFGFNSEDAAYGLSCYSALQLPGTQGVPTALDRLLLGRDYGFTPERFLSDQAGIRILCGAPNYGEDMIALKTLMDYDGETGDCLLRMPADALPEGW